MDAGATRQDVCTKCSVNGIELRTGTASGRKHYKCPKCGGEWREKNAAAMAMGRLGGEARAATLTKAQRSKQAEAAADARWRLERQAQNLAPLKDA